MKIVTIDTGIHSRSVNIAKSLAKAFHCECVIVSDMNERLQCVGHDVIVVCPTENCDPNLENLIYSSAAFSEKLIVLLPDGAPLTHITRSLVTASHSTVNEKDLGSMNFHRFDEINIPVSLSRQTDTSLSFECSPSELYQTLMFDEIKGSHALVTSSPNDESAFVRFARDKVGPIVIINQPYYDVLHSEMSRRFESSFVIRDYSQESYFNVDPWHLHALSLGLKLVWPESVLNKADETIVQIAEILNTMDYIEQLEWFDTFFSAKKYADMLKGTVL